MRTYTYDSAIYARKITLIGIFCTAVLIYAGVRILAGGSLPVWTGVGVYSMGDIHIPEQPQAGENG